MARLVKWLSVPYIALAQAASGVLDVGRYMWQASTGVQCRAWKWCSTSMCCVLERNVAPYLQWCQFGVCGSNWLSLKTCSQHWQLKLTLTISKSVLWHCGIEFIDIGLKETCIDWLKAIMLKRRSTTLWARLRSRRCTGWTRDKFSTTQSQSQSVGMVLQWLLGCLKQIFGAMIVISRPPVPQLSKGEKGSSRQLSVNGGEGKLGSGTWKITCVKWWIVSLCLLFKNMILIINTYYFYYHYFILLLLIIINIIIN